MKFLVPRDELAMTGAGGGGEGASHYGAGCCTAAGDPRSPVHGGAGVCFAYAITLGERE
jgi:hypothetical protein